MKNNTATKQELINSIQGMEEIVNDPDTSEDIKASIRPSIANAKEELAKLEAAEKGEQGAQKTEKKVEKTKPVSSPVVEKARAVVAKTKKKTTAQKQHIKKTVLPDIKKTIAKAKKIVASTRGTSQDAHIKAKSPGRRKSASGNRYYEYRSNRSDQQRRKFPYLERGGDLSSFFDESVSKANNSNDAEFSSWLKTNHSGVHSHLNAEGMSESDMRGYFSASGAAHEEYARGGQTLKGIREDKQIKALHPGWRVSESGEVYFEGRSNRSDKSRTKKLAKGGEANDYDFSYSYYYDLRRKNTEDKLAAIVEEDFTNKKIDAGMLWRLLSGTDIFSGKKSSEIYSNLGFEPHTGYPLTKKGNHKKVYAKGGHVKQSAPQNPDYNYRNDKGESAKPVGWRYTKEGAKKLGVKESASPSKAHLKKYKGKSFSVKGEKHFYLYYETRKDKSDVSRAKRLEKGGISEKTNELIHKTLSRDSRITKEEFDEWAKAKGYKLVDKLGDFHVGQKVTFTNEDGVVFKGLTILGIDKDDSFHGRQIYLNSDAFWFPHKPSELTPEEFEAGGETTSPDKDDLLPDVYYKTFTLKGNGKRQYNIFQTHSTDGLRQAARKLFPEYSYDDHLKAAYEFSEKRDAAKKKYNNTVDEYAEKEFGRKLTVLDYKISGIYRDDFSNEAKNAIRKSLHEMNEFGAAAELHASMLKTAHRVMVGTYEDGGVLPTGSIADTRYQPTFDIHSPLFEKGGMLHKIATDFSVPITDENRNEIMDLEKKGLVAIEDGKAWITGRGMKQINSAYTEFETGGMPAYFGSGQNMDVFGYETHHFSNSADVAHEFKKAITIIDGEDDGSAYSHTAKEALKDCAQNVDNLLSLEQKVIEGLPFNVYELTHALRMASIYNYKSGLHIDLNVLDKHIKSAMDALYKNEHRHLFAHGGQTRDGIEQDRHIRALHPGYRVSEEGNVYYEGRANRSDKDRIKKLEDGGTFDEE